MKAGDVMNLQINTFSDKVIQEFIARSPTLQEILKEVLQKAEYGMSQKVGFTKERKNVGEGISEDKIA